MTRKLWNHAARLTAISSAISRNVRQKRPPNASVRRRRSIRMRPSYRRTDSTQRANSGCAVRNEHVSETPDGLDKAGTARIRFDQLAQTRNLHVETAIEHFVFAATRKLHELFARQRLARMAGEHLQHREFAGG